MTTLYLDRSGSELTLQSGILTVKRPDGQRQLPLGLVERVVIAAATRLDSSLLNRLAEANVAVVLLDSRRCRRRAQWLGPGHNDAAIRLRQYRQALDERFSLNIAKTIIAAKLRRQYRWLQSLQGLPGLKRWRDPAVSRLKGLERQVENAPDRIRLRGLEGSGGRIFFEAYCRLFPASLEFHGRRRRPPSDPVNASLSLAYTLLHVRAVQTAWAAGLDPMIGFYHEPAWGRESLACDLIEPWRPCVEAWVWEWFRQRWLTAAHFSRQDNRCWLNKCGRQRFFAAFEKRTVPVQRALRHQVRFLVRHLQKEED